MSTTNHWYDGFKDTGDPTKVGFRDVPDLRDPLCVTTGYATDTVGVSALPAGSTVSFDTGTFGVNQMTTITIPVTAFSNGGRISSEMVIVRLTNLQDVARYAPATNLAADVADTGATYAKLSTWSNHGNAP